MQSIHEMHRPEVVVHRALSHDAAASKMRASNLPSKEHKREAVGCSESLCMILIESSTSVSFQARCCLGGAFVRVSRLQQSR